MISGLSRKSTANQKDVVRVRVYGGAANPIDVSRLCDGVCEQMPASTSGFNGSGIGVVRTDGCRIEGGCLLADVEQQGSATNVKRCVVMDALETDVVLSTGPTQEDHWIQLSCPQKLASSLRNGFDHRLCLKP